jgi:hypothetical protein
MSDMIDGNESRYAFVERKNDVAGPAWHGKNNGVFYGVDQLVTCEQGVTDAGGDFGIFKSQLYALLDGGRPIKADGHYMIMRVAPGSAPLPVPLGAAKEDFVPVGNLDLARMLDRQLATQWPLETVGIMENGARIFIVLKVGEWHPLELKDEHTTTYLLIHHDKRPGGGLNFTFSDVRTVCNNTVILALEEAMLNIRLKQTGDFLTRLESVMDLGSELQKLQFGSRELIEALAQKRVALDEVKQIIGQGKLGGYPDPKKPGIVKLSDQVGQIAIDDLGANGEWITQRSRSYDLALQRMETYRLDSYTLYEKLCDEFPAIAGTAYAVVQAVTEHADHRKKGKGAGDVAMSRTFGERADAKKRALQTAVGLIRGAR